jgi:hypothetical protein
MTERMLQRPGAPALRYWDNDGERPPVVLIHGVGADDTSWDQIAPTRRGILDESRLEILPGLHHSILVEAPELVRGWRTISYRNE